MSATIIPFPAQRRAATPPAHAPDPFVLLIQRRRQAKRQGIEPRPVEAMLNAILAEQQGGAP